MGKKLRFWAELYSEVCELDTMEEFELTAEEWDAFSEANKLNLVEDWAEGQLHCGYEELGEEQTLEEEIDEELEFSMPDPNSYPEDEDYSDIFEEEDEWSDE